MIRLTKIYTKTGDNGTTGLGSGQRVSKADPRVEAYGTVDEANAAIGLAISAARSSGGASGLDAAIAGVLSAIQHDLFDVGADLCIPLTEKETPGSKLRIQPAQSARLEMLIDQYNEGLGELRSFVLPAGSPLAAALHFARTVARRAERLVVHLAELQPAATNPEAVIYLNRLSDLLFVLARVANEGGKTDVLWVPGANRGP
jgi:cob(I)alamin adenosyltransferase